MVYVSEICGRMVYTQIDCLMMYESQLENLRNRQVDNIKVLNFKEREKQLLKSIADEVAEREWAMKKSVEVARNSFVVIDNKIKNHE